MKYKWCARPAVSATDPISASWGLPRPVEELLLRRGLGAEFISPDYTRLSLWSDLPGAEEASGIIWDAVSRGDRILVHGDFDADGITATATAVRTLKHLGADVQSHLPCRFSEGYGLGETGIEKCLSEGIDLVITADCGITACDEVKLLKSRGIAVVITDHHVPGEVLPAADAIVDPELAGETDAPWRYLSGAGVIHAVLRGLFKDSLPDLHDVLRPDLVAIGTICDMVRLTGDNRLLVKEGLRVMRESPVPGIAALIRTSDLKREELTAFDVGFGLGPRINSAGRITHSDKALALLLEDDPRVAQELASELDRSNQERKSLDSRVYNEAMGMLEKTTCSIAVAASASWHPGVIGISASRIARKLNRPALLISWDGETGKGSARGVAGMPVHPLLSEAMAQGYLLRFGGHSMAAGITVEKNSYHELSSFLESRASELYSEVDKPVLYIDGGLKPHECTGAVLDALDAMGPFGEGNPEPVWITRNLFPGNFRTVGRDANHLQITFQCGDILLRAIGFNMGHRTSELNRPLDIAYKLKPDKWRGGGSVQLVLEDMKPAACVRN